MQNFIKQIPNWQSLTANQIVSALNEPTIEFVDPALYTWAGVALIAGPEGAEGLRVALEQNGMGWAVHQLGGSGIQLSNPMVQQALLGFAQAGVPGCATLAATGKRNISLLEQAGLPPATVESVTEALAAIALAAAKQAKIAGASSRYNAFIDAVESWDGIGEGPVL